MDEAPGPALQAASVAVVAPAIDPWASPALPDEPDEPDGMRLVLVGAFMIAFALLVLAGTGVLDIPLVSAGGCGGG